MFLKSLYCICYCCSDLGAHIDGFPAIAAHTLIVGASTHTKATGRKADAVLAAHFASELALRLVKPGNEVIYRRKISYFAEMLSRPAPIKAWALEPKAWTIKAWTIKALIVKAQA